MKVALYRFDYPNFTDTHSYESKNELQSLFKKSFSAWTLMSLIDSSAYWINLKPKLTNQLHQINKN